MYSSQTAVTEQSALKEQVISEANFGIKECPICHARCFADMEVCYGCLHSFTEEENQASLTETTRLSLSPETNTTRLSLSPETNTTRLSLSDESNSGLAEKVAQSEPSMSEVALPISDQTTKIKVSPASSNTQVTLTDLLEIVISVRTPS